MCSTKLSTALSLSKFYRFLGRKRSEITPFLKSSKQLFQRRFYLSVSPDCKMCVRVTNTGEIIEDNVYKIYRCPIKWYKCIPTLLQENEITDQQAIEMKVV